mgnify:CR=1 FL=1
MAPQDENQKVKTITALCLAALAEAATPYGIESFDDVLEPLWRGIRSLRGKVRVCGRGGEGSGVGGVGMGSSWEGRRGRRSAREAGSLKDGVGVGALGKTLKHASPLDVRAYMLNTNRSRGCPPPTAAAALPTLSSSSTSHHPMTHISSPHPHLCLTAPLPHNASTMLLYLPTPSLFN